MKKDFTPSLLINENFEIERKRSIPKNAEILVKKGDAVVNTQVISRIYKREDLSLEKIAESVGLLPAEIENDFVVKEGDFVKKGDIVLNKKGLFNLFNTIYRSKYEGKIEFISKETGTIGIRKNPKEILLKSYLTGIVNDIQEDYVSIKSNASIIQGVFGVGGEREGILKEIKNKDDIKNIDFLENACYFCNFDLDIQSLRELSKKAVGLIIPSISSLTLNDFLGYDISIPITGNEEIDMTIIITEGFGKISFNPKIYNMLSKYENCNVSINGATQIRAGAVRPEIIIFNNDYKYSDVVNFSSQGSDEKIAEKQIRILRDPYFGRIGTVKEVLKEDYKFENGVSARAIVIKLDDKELIVPKANVEVL